ncbi:MAG: fatty acid desaturase, partial [bacterium]|nr:fatty acid desaturase [bacterium]
KWMERLFATLGTCGIQGGPIWWCSIHRLHHQYSDTPQDPHYSLKGFWYPHVLWLLYLDPRWKMPFDPKKYGERAKDLYADPYYRFLDVFFFVPWVVSLLIFFLLGGWALVFWAGFIPFLYHHHVTWSVNSVTHRFGYRSFKTKPDTDRSTNNWLVGLLAFGEGWHNNHHAFPSSPKHGFFKWWELDMTYLFVLFFKKLGLIRKMRNVTPEQMGSVRLKPLLNSRVSA